MEKRKVAEELRKASNGTSFVNISEIARFTGKARGRVKHDLLSGLDVWQDGTQKKYFVQDVAERIVEQVSKGPSA